MVTVPDTKPLRVNIGHTTIWVFGCFFAEYEIININFSTHLFLVLSDA
jgi:hypothetical protein